MTKTIHNLKQRRTDSETRYRQSDKGKAARARYWQSEKGRAARERENEAKRLRRRDEAGI
jgi:hypothetical protein